MTKKDECTQKPNSKFNFTGTRVSNYKSKIKYNNLPNKNTKIQTAKVKKGGRKSSNTKFTMIQRTMATKIEKQRG